VSGSIVLLLKVGCIVAPPRRLTGEMSGVAILCGSPTLIWAASFFGWARAA